MPRNLLVFKIQCELSCPKSVREVTWLSRNPRQESNRVCFRTEYFPTSGMQKRRLHQNLNRQSGRDVSVIGSLFKSHSDQELKLFHGRAEFPFPGLLSFCVVVVVVVVYFTLCRESVCILFYQYISLR